MFTLTNGYPSSSTSAYAEMIDAQGQIRPEWIPMLRQLDAYGAPNIEMRWQRAQRMIRENGVTYNVYGDEEDIKRPWVLDPIPRMIAHEEWQILEAGLIQRADTLNRMLGDLYGEQRLIQSKTLPSELLFSNPAFLRPCTQIKPADGQHLTIHAVDVARTPEGKWCVVKDFTQSPAGSGYALENRLVVSRTFPTMYRNSEVERLAPFFSAFRESMTRLALGKTDTPRIVMLSPGPYSPSYFEHAYLARYLGFTLVQANDLTVRQNKVFLKTLSGLRQVDVILRRQNDTFCDPLELDSQSALGIPGLVQAAAAGEVAIANALGSGLAETPALLPFIPEVCRTLLGAEPLLDTLPTLWCGQEHECNLVLDSLERWVIKSAFSHQPNQSIFVRNLSLDERAELADRIRAEPQLYIAQENMSLSTAPCWENGHLVPRHNLLRAFIVATDTGWKVLPGGLIRTSHQSESTVVSMERGGGSKDAWVQALGQVEPFTLLSRTAHAARTQRTDENLSSRMADNLFWLGRYVQRAEIQARLLRTILRRLTEETRPEGTSDICVLIQTLAILTNHAPVPSVMKTPLLDLEATRTYIYGMIFDHGFPGNLHQTLTRAVEIGSNVRERINVDTWRILDQMNQELHSTTLSGDLPDALDMLDRLLMPLAAFAGLSSESMTHGYGWRFLDMGFRIERATMSAQILRELLNQPNADEEPVLDAILETANSSITYRARYVMEVAAEPLLDLLMSDDSNPRSIAYQLARMQHHLKKLSNLPTCNILPEQMLTEELIERLNQFDLTRAVELDAAGTRPILSEFLDLIIDSIYELSTRIALLYLAHIQPTSRLSGPTGIKELLTERPA
jgi:uncharacterized circularly permuted ATP-grasp superfamily protein/uncharacterized alpha-E superfamily protein